MSSVKVLNLSSALKKLDKIQKVEFLQDAALLVEREAKLRAPVGDTGVLRESITHEVSEDTAVIGTNLFYAPYVHQGTGRYAVNGDGRVGY